MQEVSAEEVAPRVPLLRPSGAVYLRGVSNGLPKVFSFEGSPKVAQRRGEVSLQRRWVREEVHFEEVTSETCAEAL